MNVSELTVQLADAGTNLEAHVGDTITIRLPELQTAGYQWTVDAIDSAVLQLRGSSYTAPPGPRAGGAGSREIVVSALTPGASPIRLGSRRPWESGKPAAQQFAITVTVR